MVLYVGWETGITEYAAAVGPIARRVAIVCATAMVCGGEVTAECVVGRGLPYAQRRWGYCTWGRGGGATVYAAAVETNVFAAAALIERGRATVCSVGVGTVLCAVDIVCAADFVRAAAFVCAAEVVPV